MEGDTESGDVSLCDSVREMRKRRVSSRLGSCTEYIRDTDEECPPPKRRQDCPLQLPVHSSSSLSQRFLDLEQQMCQELSLLHFSSPVTHIYNPLSYAAEAHHCYVNSYVNSTKRVLFFGMNPGPFGMAQTGVCLTHKYLIEY